VSLDIFGKDDYFIVICILLTINDGDRLSDDVLLSSFPDSGCIADFIKNKKG